MKKNIISSKLDELYRKENMYANPIQTRTEPKPGITNEKPDEEKLGVNYKPVFKDEKEIKKDIGKGSKKDIGKGSKKDIKSDKKSKPKNWEFGGPKDEIHQEN